jgi:hypothetical protein
MMKALYWQHFSNANPLYPLSCLRKKLAAGEKGKGIVLGCQISQKLFLSDNEARHAQNTKAS